MDKETLRKIGTLGGALTVRRDRLWMYGQDNSGFCKEKLYGVGGPLHIGMRNREIVLGANRSDTRQTLIRELTDQSHMTRREAEEAVNELIRSGVLKEVNDPALGKILVVQER